MTDRKFESRHPNYETNVAHRRTGKLLEDGTISMRRNHSETLPKEPKEKDYAYAARVNRSTLLEAYTESVNSMSLKPFSQKIKYSQDLTDNQEFIKTDIDGNGMRIEQLANSAVKSRLHSGPWIGLIERPSLYDEGGKKISQKEADDKDLHPYVQEIDPDSLINWVIEGGKFTLAWINWVEHEKVGDEVKEVEYVKEYTVELISKYKKVEGGESKDTWELVEEFKNEIGIVPLVVSGKIDDRPILEGLAHLNLSHFRKRSDLDNILHMACVPWLHLAGFEDLDEQEISVSNALAGPASSKASWIEVSGAGIDASRQDCERLEAQMSVYGFDLVTEKGASITATEKIIDTSDDMSVLQAVVVTTMLTFTEIFQIMDMYEDRGLSEVAVEIFKDFNISFEVYKKVQSLLSLRVAGEISQETFHKELDRIKFFGDHFDPEVEAGLIEDTSGGEL